MFIVGEISKNWIDGVAVVPNGFLRDVFEQMIAHNLTRGFVLHSWCLSQTTPTPRELNETILAVFQRQVGVATRPCRTRACGHGDWSHNGAGECEICKVRCWT